MSNETDLDWLARNVHVWPAGDHQPWCYVYMVAGGAMKASGNFLDAGANPAMITIYQWISRRAELQNKPSWDDFGESAKFMAQDSDGAWMAFESEPAANYHVWSSMRGWCGYAREGRDRCRGEVLGDWRDTLERRPEQFKPFISIEDNQDRDMTQQQDMKQDNGWFERGELPPVGTECEVLWNEGRMEYLRTKVFGVNEHGQPIHRFDEGPNKFEYQADPLVTILGTRVFRPLRTERDKAIEEMCHVAGLDGLMFGLVAGKLYDAGYRKEAK